MNKQLSDIKIAIVCDWLTELGGAERVVLALHELFPKAPIYTSQYDGDKLTAFRDADIRTTWLQKLPVKLRKYLPILRAISFSHLNLSDYDLVISSSGAEAKGINVVSSTTHVCYCHSPSHYYWVRHEEYVEKPGFGALDLVARIGLKFFVGPMRKWDYNAAQKPKYLIANSNYTQKNILKYYNRQSQVIFPPVDVDRYKFTKKTARSGFIIVGRQTPYKRIDLVIEACTKLNLALTVIGNGPDHDKLMSMAGPSISFVTGASDKAVSQYLKVSRAFILPNADDFGIVAVEALAAGTPVIAYKDGGALDYVIPSKTGLFFDNQTVNSLISTLTKFDSESFNSRNISKFAERFSKLRFQENIVNFVSGLFDN